MPDDFVELHDNPGSCGRLSAERALIFEQNGAHRGENMLYSAAGAMISAIENRFVHERNAVRISWNIDASTNRFKSASMFSVLQFFAKRWLFSMVSLSE